MTPISNWCFRPSLLPSVVAALAVAMLVGLGIWQARRATWKTQLTTAYQTQINQPPATSLHDGLCSEHTPMIPAYLVKPTTLHQYSAIRLFGRGDMGQPGWRLLSVVNAPNCLGESTLMLAETGFETQNDGSVTPTTTLLATQWPDKPFVAAHNTPASNEWHWLDAERLAQLAGTESNPLHTGILLTSAHRRSLWLRRTPPARHLAYSATWFLLAFAAAAIHVLSSLSRKHPTDTS